MNAGGPPVGVPFDRLIALAALAAVASLAPLGSGSARTPTGAASAGRMESHLVQADVGGSVQSQARLTDVVRRRPAARATARPAASPRRSATSRRPVRSGVTIGSLEWAQKRGAAALGRISYPWRHLGWTISFHPARPGLLGIAVEDTRHIDIYVRRSQTTQSLAFTIAHEIGHAVDFTLSSRATHNRWLELRGIGRDTEWFGCNGCSDFRTPAGDFAEVFAIWQAGAVEFRSRIAPLPQGDELAPLVEEIRALSDGSGA